MNQDLASLSCTFKPWRGEKYGKFRGNLKLLILGESFYGQLPDKVKEQEFTEWMINKRAIENTNKRSRRFFTIIHRTIEGGKGKVKLQERTDFWHSVAFYNFIQEFVGKKSRISPSPTSWEKAKVPFEEVLSKLSPDLILILGERLAKQLNKVETLKNYRHCSINHPSSRGFSYSRWRPVINDAILECQKAKR